MILKMPKNANAMTFRKMTLNTLGSLRHAAEQILFSVLGLNVAMRGVIMLSVIVTKTRVAKCY
jgi:hypothetical protein